MELAPSRWIGRVTTDRDGEGGRFVVQTLAGPLPDARGAVATTLAAGCAPWPEGGPGA